MHGRSGELTKDAESQLQLTQFAMDNASVEIYWIGSDARIHYANNHACKTLGYTKEELVQLSLTDLDPFFPIGRWNQHWQQLKQDKSQTFETWHKRKNGVIFPVEVVANFVSLGGHEYNVGFATDISKRKHAEQVLLESEKRLSILLDSNKIHMWAFDGTNYTYTNKQWFDYTGQNPGDFLTIERWVSAVHPDDLEKSTAIPAFDNSIQSLGDDCNI